jgi:hypothetical protein
MYVNPKQHTDILSVSECSERLGRNDSGQIASGSVAVINVGVQLMFFIEFRIMKNFSFTNH